MFQGPFFIVEFYSNLKMMKKFYMESKIPLREPVKREIITCVPYAIFCHENSIQGFTSDTKN